MSVFLNKAKKMNLKGVNWPWILWHLVCIVGVSAMYVLIAIFGHQMISVTKNDFCIEAGDTTRLKEMNRQLTLNLIVQALKSYK